MEVLVRPGDAVTEGQPVLIVETDKATVEIPSPFTGVVQTVHVESGQVVHVGAPLVTVSDPGETVSESMPLPSAMASPQPDFLGGPTDDLPVPASPATRRLARELGVDLRRVRPTRPGGRVTAEDVRRSAQEAKAPERPEVPPRPVPPALEVPAEPQRPPVPKPEAAPEPVTRGPSGLGEDRRVPLRSVRRVIARRMAESWARIPHVSHHEGIDITDLERLRQEINRQTPDSTRHLSLTPFFIRAAVAVLKEFPFFNATLDEERQEIVLKGAFHIGVAVDSPRGLVVPVLKDADRKSITELAAELKKLSEKARSGELSPEDVSGGTFTLTNIGPLGGRGFTPIINHPQVAILGAGRARLEPVVTGTLEEHTLTVRLIVPVVLAFDHRVVDGADGARFMNRLKTLLEDPKQLLVSL